MKNNLKVLLGCIATAFIIDMLWICSTGEKLLNLASFLSGGLLVLCCWGISIGIILEETKD